ncbi:transcriptional regulator [Demequina soli]|uniref:transcriptional regulator n=1 Tax=Demequina soli TaxID=1638987 RepID=UPI0007813EF2|nr:transcriptional regulator [Demequina soli]
MTAQPPFDELIHAPHRLRIMATLVAVGTDVEFQALQDILEVAAPVVSKHLRLLADAGYVRILKPRGLGRARTWVEATPAGRDAYISHVAALRTILEQVGPETRTSGEG